MSSSRPVRARLGWVGLGSARLGLAGQDKARQVTPIRRGRGRAPLGRAKRRWDRQGWARQGIARHVGIRLDKTRRGIND